MNSLTIKNLQKTYKNGVVAINDISLEITNGMFGLLGPNGAGKSSLMKTIAGLQKPDSGTVLFNGINCIDDPFFIKKQLGFLPQDFGVYPKISAYDLLTHIAILKGIINTKERKEQVNFLLEKVNLYQHSNKEVHTFSGGMRQRFGIAQALLGNPQLVIVDEPTAGLDPEERNRFNNLLNEISEDIIIILSTHLVEDVKNLCKEMAIINNGTLLAKGKPTDFIAEITGKLWQKTIDKNQVMQYEKEYNVVLTQLNMGTVTIHVQSEAQPDTSFRPILPNLEDVYFSILNQK
ncbi:ATP-binding cassette domain-containing protein [Flavobacterium sp. TP390]|uniref:ATP-binding cassette domain-containing protein n=1 Tax=Flavobacterium profundi TaxID=1774945 RepID=A0A6I4IE80_9FLAO|nr:ABC transporter ATP-binding protein [Flavobacterium profundi]MVO07868.1 ATP-binding cassette domain-containing protein [Flavobacterium profundi]